MKSLTVLIVFFGTVFITTGCQSTNKPVEDKKITAQTSPPSRGLASSDETSYCLISQKATKTTKTCVEYSSTNPIIFDGFNTGCRKNSNGFITSSCSGAYGCEVLQINGSIKASYKIWFNDIQDEDEVKDTCTLIGARFISK